MMGRVSVGCTFEGDEAEAAGFASRLSAVLAANDTKVAAMPAPSTTRGERSTQRKLGELRRLGLIVFAEGGSSRGVRREFLLDLGRLPKRPLWTGAANEPRIVHLGAEDIALGAAG